MLDVDGPLDMLCTDCARLPPTMLRNGGMPRLDAFFVVVGGAWDSPSGVLRNNTYTTRRDADTSNQVGFRCARDL